MARGTEPTGDCLFQSRSGFLPPCDGTPSDLRPYFIYRFNPVLGFYRPATSNSSSRSSAIDSFQSRSGFLPPCDPTTRRRSASRKESFNPVLGFYRPATYPLRGFETEEVSVSIPFWVSTALRPPPLSQLWAALSVSIPFWVSTALRHIRVKRIAKHRHVSIPFWVSTALRRCDFRPPSADESCFNPVLGFYRPATMTKSRVEKSSVAFQSRSGFLPPCDIAAIACCFSASLFQSRSGFLPPCDMGTIYNEQEERMFQSRSGFLPPCDGVRVRIGPYRCVFQSRSGFLPPCDRSARLGWPSISRCFNPVLGFYRPATSPTPTRPQG